MGGEGDSIPPGDTLLFPVDADTGDTRGVPSPVPGLWLPPYALLLKNCCCCGGWGEKGWGPPRSSSELPTEFDGAVARILAPCCPWYPE